MLANKQLSEKELANNLETSNVNIFLLEKTYLIFLKIINLKNNFEENFKTFMSSREMQILSSTNNTPKKELNSLLELKQKIENRFYNLIQIIKLNIIELDTKIVTLQTILQGGGNNKQEQILYLQFLVDKNCQIQSINMMIHSIRCHSMLFENTFRNITSNMCDKIFFILKQEFKEKLYELNEYIKQLTWNFLIILKIYKKVYYEKAVYLDYLLKNKDTLITSNNFQTAGESLFQAEHKDYWHELETGNMFFDSNSFVITNNFQTAGESLFQAEHKDYWHELETGNMFFDSNSFVITNNFQTAGKSLFQAEHKDYWHELETGNMFFDSNNFIINNNYKSPFASNSEGDSPSSTHRLKI
jgi:hypothetical protein